MDEQSELKAMREELAELRQWKADQEAKSAQDKPKDAETETPGEEGDKLLQLRKERPLPKRGCSWAFYLFLALLLVMLAVMYIRYRMGS